MYMSKLPAAPASGPKGDQRWATFLKNHALEIIECDFYVAAPAAFRVLYGLVVMDHALWRLIHLRATAPHPTAVRRRTRFANG